MVCPVCFAHCDVDNGRTFSMYFRDVDASSAIIPCSAMQQFPQQFAGGFLNFRAHGLRYAVDVYVGHNIARIGGNDLRKFIKDFKLGHGELVVFMMTGRIAKAVVYLGGFFVVGGVAEAAEGVAGIVDEEEGDQGVAGQVGGGGNNAPNVEEGLPGIIYNKDANLVEEEADRLGLLIAIDEGYIGRRFVHHLTSTNVTKKLMRIPNRVRELLNIPEVGFVGIRLGEEQHSRVAYKTNIDGRMVFNKEWGVFAMTTNLQAGSAALFTFQMSNVRGLNVMCVVDILTI